MEEINKEYIKELADLDNELVEKQEALELEYQAKRNQIVEKYESLRSTLAK